MSRVPDWQHAPRPLKVSGVLFEQQVELDNQRQNFQRLFRAQIFAPSGPDLGDGLAKQSEETQPEPDPQNDGQDKREPQHGQRDRQCCHRFP